MTLRSKPHLNFDLDSLSGRVFPGTLDLDLTGSGMDGIEGGKGGDFLVGGDGPDEIDGGDGFNVVFGDDFNIGALGPLFNFVSSVVDPLQAVVTLSPDPISKAKAAYESFLWYHLAVGEGVLLRC